MARPASISITQFRFRGHADTLNALCQCFRDRKRESLTAAQLADLTGRAFDDVHARLAQVPELFSQLPMKPKTNRRYLLTLRIERLSAADTAAFIETQARSETLIAFAFAATFLALLALLSVLTALN